MQRRVRCVPSPRLHRPQPQRAPDDERNQDAAQQNYRRFEGLQEEKSES